MNKVFEVGTLTKDCELRYSQNNKPICSFDIAVNEGFGDKKTTDYFKVVLFGGEKLSSYLVKGTKVAVVGKLKNNNYEDKNGIKHYTTQIIADTFGGVELLGGKKDNSAPTDNFSGGFDEDLQQVDDGSDMPF
jgi:single-strand DNA-binding protein